jgi:hypothetical protein
MTDHLPDHPTRAMCIQMLAMTYKRGAISMVMATPIAALDGKTPDELIDAGEAHRVYAWAVGLAEGVMG